MKKTYNVNLAGSVYIIDDDAYTLLNDYLDTIQRALVSNGETDDLLIDIEARISELLQERVLGAAAVVTISDVESIIARIGRPEDFIEIIEEEKDSPEGTPQEDIKVTAEEITPPPMPNVPKKLYRDPQGAMIGGVCAGLACYLGIDVTWVRLIMVLLCFASLSALVIIYVILWIVVPEARTPYEQMQMRGESFSVSNIGRTVTETFRRSNDPEAAAVNPNPSTAPRFASGIAHFFGILGRILVIAASIIAIPVLIGLAIAFLGCVIALIIFCVANISSWSWFNWPGGNYGTLIFALCCGLGYIITLGIPLLLLVSYAFQKNPPLNKPRRRALLYTWLVGLMVAGVFTGLLIADDDDDEVIWKNDSRTTITITQSPKDEEEDSSGTQTVEIIDSVANN